MAVFLLSVVGVRVLAQLAFLSQTDARVANGLGAILFLVIALYLTVTDGRE